jgi:multimeric flavodoxin WrbA
MATETVKILGISGSPRRDGNTAGMVKYCLEWAKSTGYVETEYLSLADYKLTPCIGCMKCFGYMAPADDEYKCYDTDDDIKVLAPKVLECDGLLIGYPVYAYGIPGLLTIFLEKLHHFGPMSFTRHAGSLRFKAMGIISQGGQPYGGQEINHMHMVGRGSALGMYVVDSWPTAEAPMSESTHVGGILTCVDGTAVYGKNAWMKKGTRTMPPVAGSRNERTLKNLGRHLAVAAMTLKLGRETFKEKGFEEPEIMSFTRYSVKPKKGSYVEKLTKEGKVAFISKDELDAMKKPRS